MPRYVIESPGMPHIPLDGIDARSCGESLQHNLTDEVRLLHSYVSLDQRRTFCVCDGPTLEAIRRAAGRNCLPVTRITEVRLLGP